MPDKFSISEFAAEVKKRRPDLANISNDMLVGKLIAARPELKDVIDLNLEMPKPEGILSQLFGHLGVQKGDPGLATTSIMGTPTIDPTRPSVASEGAAQVTKGVGLGIKNAPSATWDFLNSVLQTSNPAKQIETLTNLYQGAKSLVAPVARMDTPGSPSWEAAQQGSGALLAQSELPNAISGGLGAAAYGARSMIPESLPANLYESALKPGPRSNTRPEIQRMIATGLREGIPVTAKGSAKTNALIDALNTDITNRIQQGAGQGVTVNKYSVASRLSPLAKALANQVTPESDLRILSNKGNEFLRNQPGEIPADIAQQVKVGTYRALGDKAYGELKGADIETQKSLARGIKEELAAKIPEITRLNLSESDLLQLKPELDAAINRISNKDVIGIGTPIATGAVAAATGSPTTGVIAGILKSLLDRPGLKSQLAIALERARLP